MKHEILLGLTTTPNSNWKEKIKEIKKLNIKKLALFPTGIGLNERKVLYNLLEETNLKSIPHVHLRNDMKIWEIEYLSKKFNSKLFNTHPKKTKYGFDFKNSTKYINGIFIENISELPSKNELNSCGGLCLDFSHWENARKLKMETYDKKLRSLAEKYPIGCCHISAISSKMIPDKDWSGYDLHSLTKLSELNYMKNYITYLPKYISIELENSFEKQLEIKKYLEKILYGQIK